MVMLMVLFWVGVGQALVKRSENYKTLQTQHRSNTTFPSYGHSIATTSTYQPKSHPTQALDNTRERERSMPRRKDARRGGAGKSSGATAAVGSGAGSAADVRTPKHDVSPDCKADTCCVCGPC